MNEDEAPQRRETYYSGRVQGVGFRYTTRNLAQDYQVAGFVRNIRDGRVEVVVEGVPTEVERFLAAIQSALGHYIAGIQQNALPATGQFHQFEIRF